MLWNMEYNNHRCILLKVNYSHSVTVLQGHHSVGLMWWMLAREVLRMRGTISREHPWEVMPDLYFYRDPEEVRHAVHPEKCTLA